MKNFVITLVILAATATSNAQITGAGNHAYSYPGGSGAKHAWLDFTVGKSDYSLYVFGWDQPQPLVWFEGFPQKTYRLGSLNFQPGAFVAFAAGTRQAGAGLQIFADHKGCSFYTVGYLVAEERQKPTLFIPAARFLLPERDKLRFGIEGSFVAQGDWNRARIGPVAAYRVSDSLTLRLSFLKGTRTESGDELRFTTLIRF